MSSSEESSMSDDSPKGISENALAYWRSNVGLIRIILLIWGLVSLGISVLFMPFLQDIYLPGFKVSLPFWFAHQGAIYVFVILIFTYAYLMDSLDRKHDMEDK